MADASRARATWQESHPAIETWKGIADALDRSERWCRYMAGRSDDPLPVFKVGGIARLNVADLEAWLGRQRDRALSAAGIAQIGPSSGGVTTAGDADPHAEAERLRDENAYLRDENARLRAELVLAKEDHW